MSRLCKGGSLLLGQSPECSRKARTQRRVPWASGRHRWAWCLAGTGILCSRRMRNGGFGAQNKRGTGAQLCSAHVVASSAGVCNASTRIGGTGQHSATATPAFSQRIGGRERDDEVQRRPIHFRIALGGLKESLLIQSKQQPVWGVDVPGRQGDRLHSSARLLPVQPSLVAIYPSALQYLG